MIASLALAAAINAAVNGSVAWADDRDTYGAADHWTAAGTRGDCEDIALAKRLRLLSAGADPASVRLAVVRLPDPAQPPHVVLEVLTAAGLRVLDSLNHDLRTRQQALLAGYRWRFVVRAGQWIAL